VHENVIQNEQEKKKKKKKEKKEIIKTDEAVGSKNDAPQDADLSVPSEQPVLTKEQI
jgi:hypothetical protein